MNFLKELRKTDRYIHRAYAEHEPDAPILSVNHLSLRYETGAALENITFHLHDGERMAVVGPNGAGKSTLFKIIAGVVESTAGTVTVRGGEPGKHICIAYLPQRSQVDWSFPATVADTVMMGRVQKIGLFRVPGREDRRQVRDALRLVGLEDLAGRQISQLSGGQQQRMFVARALAQEAELMLMDEPLTGLDAASQADLFGVLDLLRQRNVAVMVALHDLELAATRFDRVMLLNRRLISVGTPERALAPDKLAAAYGGRLRVMPGQPGVIALDDSCCGEDHTHD